jgi:hypothetical protein
VEGEAAWLANVLDDWRLEQLPSKAYVMSDETANGSGEIRDAGGSPGGSAGEQSPLQARAAFIANWDWQSVIRHNRGVCERGGAQHGKNSESFEGVRKNWERSHTKETTLEEVVDFLRSCHRRAPFLFFNGNTFAEIGRTFSDYLFAELPTLRRREATSAVAHYIAGVLDREAMVEIVEGLCASAEFQPGDRVKTLRGTTHGVVIRLLENGRVVWRPDRTPTDLTALPESLLREKPRQ